MKGCVIALLLPLMLLAGMACQTEGLGGTPTTADAVATPTKDASVIFTAASDGFKAATSYRFKLQAVHEWSSEGQEQRWEFSGEGTYTKPDRFRSRMEGPADTYFEVEIIGNKVVAKDSRGEVSNATTTFGGPGFGASPYTVIAYLTNAQKVEPAGLVSLNGTRSYHYMFEPEKEAVAAVDAAHASEMQKVTAIRGEVWVSETDGRVLRERVKVDFLSRRGAAEMVTMTLDFFDYDKKLAEFP